MSLEFVERPADGEAQGQLILHHGRGSYEGDLLPIADALDPQRRLHVVAPRAPLELPGSPGYHWYLVPRVGYPDPDSFHAALKQLSDFHDDVFERTGIPAGKTVLGGFSMGAVMSYSAGLSADRPQPAGILALSGFIPGLDDWKPDLTRSELPVFVSHGDQDPVINVSFARTARDTLTEAGFPVAYLEFSGGHWVDPVQIEPATEWLDAALKR
jgi:phospholipase/carboxylesterase